MQKVYLVHGYLANQKSHWFEWLGKKISEKGYDLEIISLSDSDNPKYEKWNHDISKSIDSNKDEIIIIAHSLGCISTLDYLSKKNKKIKKLILVSGFYEKINVLPVLDEFIENCEIKFDLIQSFTKEIDIFVSSNDALVPPKLSYDLACRLNANIYNVKNAGHFLDSDGYTEFNEILDLF